MQIPITNAPSPLTKLKIRSTFSYDPVTGEIIRYSKHRPDVIISDRPLRFRGSTPTVIVNKQTVHIVSLAWYLHHDYWPHKPPKFLNGNKRDFRMENLRYAY